MAVNNVIKRSFSSTPALDAIKKVTVIGGGIMGSGIAQVAAQVNQDVTLIDVNDSALEKATRSIRSNLRRVANKRFKDSPVDGDMFVSTSLSKIKFSTDLESAVKESELVLEAAVEDLKLKRKLFSSIDKISPEGTIFASNTSSMLISEIASVTERKDRFIGLHFFNPPVLMKLIEVVRTTDTSDETYRTCMEWCKALGKVAVTCKDTPGFIVNKLTVPMFCKAATMIERGDASAKDIDTALKLGSGLSMGPLEIVDLIGLDIVATVVQVWREKFPDDQDFVPVKILNDLIKEGKLGRKTGEGFYKYNQEGSKIEN